jgi:hypothetical protein
LQSGVARYELAQLHDLQGEHLAALFLHAKNREQYPRFFRGRYRLAMSLEMVTHRDLSKLRPNEVKRLRQICETSLSPDLHRHVAVSSERTPDCSKATEDSRDEDDIYVLRLALLSEAQKELEEVRKQLVLWRILWASFRHRDERAIWVQYLGLTERQRFHDGARVAQLYITIRRCIVEREKSNGAPGKSRSTESAASNTNDNNEGNRNDDFNARRALRIVAAVAGELPVEIKSLLPTVETKSHFPNSTKEKEPGKHASKTRWLPWQCRTPSWPAAYNTACLYGVAFEHCAQDEKNREAIAKLAVLSLKRAITPKDSEMRRPSDWINVDPDFADLKKMSSPKEFRDFLEEQKQVDYPRSARRRVSKSSLKPKRPATPRCNITETQATGRGVLHK